MDINKKTLGAFRTDFTQAMQALQEKYNVTISLGHITYSEERFTGKLTVTNGLDPEEAARNAFDADVWIFEHLGLREGMYNRVFIGEDGKRYAIKGFNTRKCIGFYWIIIHIREEPAYTIGERRKPG